MFYGGSIFSSSGFRRFCGRILMKIFRNDSYCWYGLARNYTAAAKSVGYVKYPNITECPGTTLSKTQVAALFGS